MYVPLFPNALFILHVNFYLKCILAHYFNILLNMSR